jgi:ubiquinone/menaquinone biosynthesis C-methylase UbiE
MIREPGEHLAVRVEARAPEIGAVLGPVFADAPHALDVSVVTPFGAGSIHSWRMAASYARTAPSRSVLPRRLGRRIWHAGRMNLEGATRPGWLLDEVASAGRENLDADHVARYDDKEDADATQEVELLVSLGIGTGSTVVDVGAGTGQLSLALADVCDRVIAVDVSPVMLERLRAKAAARDVTNLAVEQAGFLTYEHSGPPADALYSRYALHHLPDFWKAVALERIHAMLRPGGFLRLWDVVYSFPLAEAAERVEEWCALGTGDVGDGWSRTELEEHIRDEGSTFTWLLEPMIERAGFAIETRSVSADQFSARYVLRRP